MGSVEIFTVTAAGAEGLTYKQTRGPRFSAPTAGVRTASDPTWLQQVQAAALVLPEGAAFSHSTALNLLGVPFDEGHLPLHVSVSDQKARGRRELIRWHSTDLRGMTRTIRGVTVTTAWKTWLDMGASVPLPDLVAVTDALLKRRYLASSDLVVAQGRRGARNLRRAAELGDPRSNSIRESQLRVHFVSAGFPPADLNADIMIDGDWIAVCDFVWWEYKTIVEYDGDDHATLDQRHQDAITREDLRRAGWEVKVLTAKHYRRLTLTLREIGDLLRERGWRPEGS